MTLFVFGLIAGLLAAGIVGVCAAIGAFTQGYRRAVAIQNEISEAQDSGHAEGYDKAVEDLAALDTKETEQAGSAVRAEPIMWIQAHLECLYQWMNARDSNDRFMFAFNSAQKADRENDARN